jgi:hypothetical protein
VLKDKNPHLVNETEENSKQAYLDGTESDREKETTIEVGQEMGGKRW